jgi:glycosyltransferase involved in cell wall biosynthesis
LALYKSEPLRIELGIKGKEFVQNEFSWEKTSKKLIHLYNNLQV